MREQITIHNFANSAPVINWLKNNSGEKLLTLVSAINTPAVAAAVCIETYKAKENDEISLQLGDLISVIDMPEPSKSIWWRGKRGFEVGFFPSHVVEVIGEESSVLNPANLKQLIKQHVGSLRFKESNNENENLLVYLLKCKQLTDDDKLSIHKLKELNSNENNLSNGEENLNCDRTKNRNDKKPLIECQTNSLNSMNKHSKTPKIINLRSISPLLKTDHRFHTPLQSSQQVNFASTNSANPLNQTPSTTSQLNTSNHTGNSVFQRRNRISSTLPKSLNSTTNKPVCVNLFNQTNFNNFDTSNTSNLSPSNQTTFNHINRPINNTPNSLNSTNDPNNNSTQMGNNNKRGKLSSFLRSIINRNSNSENQYDKRSSALKRNEKSNVLINLRKNKKILVKNTVFGCELNDYLSRTSSKIPLVLKSCCEWLEENGIVHGIYRLSGVNSNIQKLIKCFNDDQTPDFTDDIFLQDVHCVSSLLKLYFRELPNPLLTFELYDNFVKAIQPSYDPNAITTQHEELPERTKLSNLIKVLKMLPLNHYVSLEYLVRHLNKIASYSDQTGMTIKNLGIVWSPNLLRSRELETQGGIGALQCISIQAVLTEYLIRFCDDLFTEESRPFNYFKIEQDDNLNGSFLGENNLSPFNQSNSFSSPSSSRQDRNNLLNDSQANNQPNENEEDKLLEVDENHFEEDSQQSSDSIDNNKFPIKDSNLISLKEAQRAFKCKLLDDHKTIDQLISSNFNMKACSNRSLDDKNENNFSLVGPCLMSLSSSKSNSPNVRNFKDDDENDENKCRMNDSIDDDQPTFGVLGKFSSSRRKRFGNLDLVDENDTFKESKSFVSKRRTLFEKVSNKQDEFKNYANDENSRNTSKDRFRYKTFDESDEDLDNLSRSNNSLKLSNSRLDQSNEPIQRYHTILNPKHFNKNKILTSTPKELNPNLFSKRTQAKWNPSKM